MKPKPAYIFIALCTLFIIYSFFIYLTPHNLTAKTIYNKKKAANGRLIWQSYNCQSCHQLYGLGGYLGPDLTNIISNPKKGETVIRAMLKSGINQMPVFNLPENELSELIEFLKSTNASGTADPRKFTNKGFGFIERNESK